VGQPQGNIYPRVLNGDGCLYGQHLGERIVDLEKRMDCFESKLNKILWALVSFTVALGSSAMLLGLNLVVP